MRKKMDALKEYNEWKLEPGYWKIGENSEGNVETYKCMKKNINPIHGWESICGYEFGSQHIQYVEGSINWNLIIKQVMKKKKEHEANCSWKQTYE
jgi:hypothetical protein